MSDVRWGREGVRMAGERLRDFMGADVGQASVVGDQDGRHKRQTGVLHAFPNHN